MTATPTTLPIHYRAQVTMPPGTYFLGDPCYAIDDRETWDSFLHMAWANEDAYSAGLILATIDDQPVLGMSTLYGDGGYQDQYGARTFAVDAGMIGLVPVALVERYSDKSREELDRLGLFISTSEPLRCTSMGGTLSFGDIRIETDD